MLEVKQDLKNDLTIYRRHASNCIRPLNENGNKDMTKRPTTPQGKKADESCNATCFIWSIGYLKNQLDITGKQIRINKSLGTKDWTEAEQAVAKLYELGRLPKIDSGLALVKIDPNAVKVTDATTAYLEYCKGDVMEEQEAVQDSTFEKYAFTINMRLVPWCAENGYMYVKAFEDKNVCKAFVKSWKQTKRHPGKPLGKNTAKSERQRFVTLLNWWVGEDWMSKSGMDVKKGRRGSARRGANKEERYGLEISEFERLMDAPDSAGLTAQENLETSVACLLMRWVGPRISDCHKFNSSEIDRYPVLDENGNQKLDKNGKPMFTYDANYIQKKTGTQCISPMPDFVFEALDALPGRMVGDKKYFFTCSYTALRQRVEARYERAETASGKFNHHFSPHCLRHTFAIQHKNAGTPIAWVSRWLGHNSEKVTIEHYGTWIDSTKRIADQFNRDMVAKMLLEAEAYRASIKPKEVAA